MAQDVLQQEIMQEVERRLEELRRDIERFVASALQGESIAEGATEASLNIAIYGEDSFTRATSGIVNGALRGLLNQGEVDIRQLGRGVLRQAGRELGQSVGDALFDDSATGVRLGSGQIGAQLLEGLSKGQRNR
jgi:hypothetical protein